MPSMPTTPAPLRCLHCDALPHTPGANFCGQCGALLPPPDYETPAFGERVTRHAPERKRHILHALLVVPLIGLVFGIGFVFASTLLGWLAPASPPIAQARGITQTMPAEGSLPPASTTTNTTAASAPPTVAPLTGSALATVYFSPNGGAQDAIIREIDSAKEWIHIQAYSFTSAPIAQALVKAHKRGVRVKVILDKSNQMAQYSSATFLTNAGIPTLIDDRHAIAHNKIMLIDGATVLTGSFNFSKAAEEKNAENLLVLKNCPDLMNAYNANFRGHEAHAATYTRK